MFILFSIYKNYKSKELLILRESGDSPPYEMVTNGKLTGIHIDIIKAVAKQLGYRVKFESVSWPKALMMMKEKKADAISYLTKTPSRENYIYYLDGNILSNEKNVIITEKSMEKKIKYNGTLNSLKNYNILMVKGYSYGTAFDNAYFLKKHVINDWKKLPNLISSGKYDIAIVNWKIFYSLYHNTKFFKEISPLLPPVSLCQQYLGFAKTKRLERIAKQFSDEFTVFKKSQKYAEIMKKYSSKT